MRSGAIASAILHAIIIALTIWSLPDWFGDTVFLESEPVPVEIMTISEMTNIMETTKEDKVKPPEDPKPTPKPQELVSIPPEELELTEPEIAPPVPDALPEPPPPEPVAEEKKPDPPPKVVKPPKPKPADEKPKKKKKEDFDVDQVLKDLLAEAPAQAEQEEPKPSDKTRQRVGAGTALTMTEKDALVGQISKCWSPPAGAPNPEQFVVTLRVEFGQDGRVRGIPEVEEMSRMGEPYFRQFAEAAQRAMIQCGPYQLVVDRYESLQEVDVVMDPSKFAGY